MTRLAEHSPPPTLLTVMDVARALQVSRSRVFELLASGQLRSVKFGQSRRIPQRAIDEFVANLEAGDVG